MKKYFIGIAVTITFLAYSIVLRHQHSEAVLAPASLGNNSSASSTPATTTNPTTTTTNPPVAAQYKDGTFSGSTENAFYGNVQVSAVILGGKITDVKFLQSPNENPNSIYINQQAMPYLKQEAIQAQSANVNIITGATYTSQAFIQSLTNALNQAKLS
jgi:uncharacterized protein with FMN-binding domain